MTPPGLDVVCFSNGSDWVKGFRNALNLARAGRVVMVVDCTNILNLRHLEGNDRAWLTKYPTNPNDIMTFDEVVEWSADGTRKNINRNTVSSSSSSSSSLTIVT